MIIRRVKDQGNLKAMVFINNKIYLIFVKPESNIFFYTKGSLTCMRSSLADLLTAIRLENGIK